MIAHKLFIKVYQRLQWSSSLSRDDMKLNIKYCQLEGGKSCDNLSVKENKDYLPIKIMIYYTVSVILGCEANLIKLNGANYIMKTVHACSDTD